MGVIPKSPKLKKPSISAGGATETRGSVFRILQGRWTELFPIHAVYQPDCGESHHRD